MRDSGLSTIPSDDAGKLHQNRGPGLSGGPARDDSRHGSSEQIHGIDSNGVSDHG